MCEEEMQEAVGLVTERAGERRKLKEIKRTVYESLSS